MASLVQIVPKLSLGPETFEQERGFWVVCIDKEMAILDDGAEN